MNAAQPISFTENNKKLLLYWFEEVWGKGRREVIHELMDPDVVLHDGSNQVHGPDAFASFHDAMHRNFAEFRVTPGPILAEGDVVGFRWEIEMRHVGSGRLSRTTGITMARVQNGKFVEAWQNWDAGVLAAQLPDVALPKL